MRTVSEQEIAGLAPNAAAVANGRKISSGGGFVSRMRSEDDTFYMGECRGSGKSNYIVSADFIQEGAPVFRCSCPSRQFPCKHSIALLFEIAAGKEFQTGEIPKDILDKRARKEAREVKKEKREEKGQGGGKEGGAETGGNASGRKRPAGGAAKAARTKKLKKQLEGLAMMKQLTDQLIASGLASMGSVSLKTYRELAKQLGDYYLPGPQRCINELILQIEKYQRDSDESRRRAAVKILIRLRALGKKADAYIRERIDSESAEDTGSVLFEELGGIWRLEQLEELGLKKENRKLVQLSFSVLYDEAGREYVDEAFWADLETGEISVTRNFRPVKALKYIKQEDSCFAKLTVPTLVYYPGDMNRRIRWDSAVYGEITDRDIRRLRETAWTDIPAALMQVKGQIKNTLSDDFCAMLLSFSRVGRIERLVEDGQGKKYAYVLEDREGNRIELRDRKGAGWEPCTELLDAVPEPGIFKGQAMFGMLYYDERDRKICMHPRSIVTEDRIVRLLY